MLRSVLLAAITGLLLAIAWPTKGLAGLLFIAFVPLLIIEKQFTDAPFNKKALRIFLLSWLSFLMWNALAYSWLANAKPQTDPTAMEVQQAWMAYIFPVVLNSLFMALIFLMYHFIRKKHGDVYGFLFLPAIWMSFEKLHLNWDFTWPWLNLGNGFASNHTWIQWYDLTGTFGGTLWVWIANLLLFKAVILYLEHAEKKRILRFSAGFALAVMVPILISLVIYNNYEEKGEEIEVTLIQPELNPYREKYTKTGDEIVNEILTLADKGITENTSLVITPETSFPGRGEIIMNSMAEDPLVNKFISWVSNNPGKTVIAGVELANVTQATQAPNVTSFEYQENLYVNRYNSTVQIENSQDSIPYYHKSKLVVGVEYFPYPSVLKPLLGNAMLNFGGSTNSLTKSTNPTVFTNSQNNARVAPLICYESVFGEFTSEFVKKDANLISVSTNDSWWGNTDGHRQFLDYARLRAIENRRDVVRAANSGVSAIINQKGDIVEKLDYGKQGFLTGNVRLNSEKTSYTLAGDLLARISLLISSVILAYHFAEKLMNRTSIIKA